MGGGRWATTVTNSYGFGHFAIIGLYQISVRFLKRFDLFQRGDS